MPTDLERNRKFNTWETKYGVAVLGMAHSIDEIKQRIDELKNKYSKTITSDKIISRAIEAFVKKRLMDSFPLATLTKSVRHVEGIKPGTHFQVESKDDGSLEVHALVQDGDVFKKTDSLFELDGVLLYKFNQNSYKVIVIEVKTGSHNRKEKSWRAGFKNKQELIRTVIKAFLAEEKITVEDTNFEWLLVVDKDEARATNPKAFDYQDRIRLEKQGIVFAHLPFNRQALIKELGLVE